MIVEHKFSDRELASSALAERVATRLSQKLSSDSQAHVVVSGGTTPIRLFQLLSDEPLPWDRVSVGLSDERWVPATHEDSNEGLLLAHLKHNKADNVTISPVYKEATQIADRCAELSDGFPANRLVMSVLGMGGDGHFASLFPDADDLGTLLDENDAQRFAVVKTAASPHPRVSMTLSAILESDEVVLFFFGDEKFEVYEAAINGDNDLPIAALLTQQRVPVNLFWAP